MRHNNQLSRQERYQAPPAIWDDAEENNMFCNWTIMRAQLLSQWMRLTRKDLDKVGPDRKGIAMLIQQKYGIAHELAENYLKNFERTMPLLGCA